MGRRRYVVENHAITVAIQNMSDRGTHVARASDQNHTHVGLAFVAKYTFPFLQNSGRQVPKINTRTRPDGASTKGRRCANQP